MVNHLPGDFQLVHDQRVNHCSQILPARPSSGGRELSLSRPVRASADMERAAHVVDGTDSEWFLRSDGGSRIFRHGPHGQVFVFLEPMR